MESIPIIDTLVYMDWLPQGTVYVRRLLESRTEDHETMPLGILWDLSKQPVPIPSSFILNIFLLLSFFHMALHVSQYCPSSCPIQNRSALWPLQLPWSLSACSVSSFWRTSVSNGCSLCSHSSVSHYPGVLEVP